MATVTKLAINLAYHGQEAEAGLERTSKAMRDTGIAALDAANKFSQLNQDKIKSGGLDKDQIRSLTKLSELDQERAIDRMSEENALRKMSRSSQLIREQMMAATEAQSAADSKSAAENEKAAKTAESLATSAAARVKADADARALQISKLSKLDQQRLFDKEKREAAILAMTPRQQLVFEKAEKAKLKAAQEADRLAGLSFTGRIKESLKGMQDVKATLEMIRGISLLALAGPKMLVSSLTHMVELGAKLQTTQIRMGMLAGSFDAGAASLEKLRQTSRDFGGPLDELVAGFTALRNNGISNEDSTALLRTFSSIGGILGEGGVGALAASVGTMAKSGIADLAGLRRMADSGLNVFEELGKRLGVTGKEAESMVERGAVNATTAIHAMQAAANSPQAKEAASQFSASFQGQIAQLSNTVNEFMADIGKAFIEKIDIASIAGGIKGAFQGVSDVVMGIIDMFGSIDLGGPEDSFISMRTIVIDLAESLLIGLANAIDDMGGIETIANKIIAKATWWADFYKAESFAQVGEANDRFQYLSQTADFHVKDGVFQQKTANDIVDATAKIKDMFGKMRAENMVKDFEKMFDLADDIEEMVGPPAPGKAQQMPDIAPPQIADAFTALRDLQAIGGGITAKGRADALAAIEAMRGRFGVRTDNFAASAQANTAAAQEAILRNRGGGEANAVDQLRELIEMTKRDMATTQQKQDQLIDAVRNQRLVIPAQKL